MGKEDPNPIGLKLGEACATHLSGDAHAKCRSSNIYLSSNNVIATAGEAWRNQGLWDSTNWEAPLGALHYQCR